MVVLLAGTPGTGKSSLASLLVRNLNYLYASLTEVVLESGAWDAYDWARRSFTIDPSRAVRALRERVRRLPRIVIESHDVGLVWEAGVEPVKVFVLRCRPSVLYERLSRREWPLRKVVENLEAELIGVVASEAREFFGDKRVCEIDTSRLGVHQVFEIVKKSLLGAPCSGSIDWLSDPAEVEMVSSLSTRAWSL